MAPPKAFHRPQQPATPAEALDFHRPAPAMRALQALVFAAISVALLGCASAPRCGAGQTAAVQELIYFGADTPAGPVTDLAWAEFLSGTVRPRFPDGLSVWSAQGQWRSAAGPVIQEPSHVLSLVHPGHDATEQAVLELIQDYKTRFQQEAVLRVRSSVCMSL